MPQPPGLNRIGDVHQEHTSYECEPEEDMVHPTDTGKEKIDYSTLVATKI